MSDTSPTEQHSGEINMVRDDDTLISTKVEKFKLHTKVTDPLCLSLLNWQAEKQQPQFRGSRGDDTT